MAPPFIPYDAAARLTWPDAVEAIRAGHERPRADLGDIFLGPSDGTLLTRAAFIPGLGYGVKAVSVMPGNPGRGLPSVQGAMTVFDPDSGAVTALIDSKLVTEFKTAADSVLGARLLARPDSRHLLIVGAGTVARSLIHAYAAVFPGLERITLWARRPEQARDLADDMKDAPIPPGVAEDLSAALAEADIVSTATMATQPVLKGEFVRPGTHVDLIGAFRADMREADDALMRKGRLFVDSRDTTIGHIGELTIPIAAGVIDATDVLGDFYDLVQPGAARRGADDEITVFKNGGGAHMDLMIADYIARAIG
ncbi:ornithine cyclodeaminase family protein [Palleronia pelagia]|uniref:Ornithine cyclodeaminase n=1 Tax=Palleronia pelagia TaxID=387096 RepID=A0A1H8JIM0_9RHOB|nr:ornithine cyclodeaminase [Palleronia pelagia]SEN80156.1 ornithine cyclodeaminase [Palleronia pelagia]